MYGMYGRQHVFDRWHECMFGNNPEGRLYGILDDERCMYGMQ